MRWLTRQVNRLLHWLRRLFRRKRSTYPPSLTFHSSVQQNNYGDRNQIIAQMHGGTAIANLTVKKLIQHFHLAPQEVISLARFWENWSLETNPQFTPKLVIGGREEEQNSVLSWLRGSPSVLTLQGDSREEALAFLAAVVQNLDEAERVKVLSRAIVVDSATAWQSLISSSDEPFILVARFEELEGTGLATQNGHHVFIPLGRTTSDKKNCLPRIKRNAAEEALAGMGFSYNEVRRHATLARRSLSALRRKLAIAPNIRTPAWALPQEARVLLAPLLVSAWSDSNDGDRQALAQLSAMPSESLQNHLGCWANEPDPPIRKTGHVWLIASQEDAWRLLARNLTNDDLNRFESVALEVLGELDPAFELPLEQRFAASIYGKELTHSGYLRKGISEMLALMAALSAEIDFIADRTGDEVARQVVWKLMQKTKNNVHLWASLANLLPLLAEATPGIFLDAVEVGLSGDDPVFLGLFQDRDPGAALMASSPHTGLLWALETLAWHPDYLSRAALNLARLTRLDPGGQLGNRPGKSLRDIFICWHPHTTAPLTSRLNVLDTIRKREPEVAWHLLMSLLPKRHSAVSPTHGTKWRDWVPDTPVKITAQEYREATTAILNRLIEDAGTHSARWCGLITAMSGMEDEQQKILLQHLESLEPSQFPSRERAEICDCLRSETTRHLDFLDADWAMPAEHIQRLEAVKARFEPKDPLDRYRWLFSHNLPLPEMRSKRWEERDQVAQELRVEALQTIIKAQGWTGVLNLAEQASEPGLVGQILATGELLPIELSSFLEENLASSEAWRSQLAKRFVTASAYKRGKSWIQDCLNANLQQWRTEQYGEFLLCLPFNESLLDRLDNAPEEVQHYFWSRTQSASLLDATQAERVLSQLLKHQRPHFAVNLINWAIPKTPELVPPERIAEVLEVAAQSSPSPELDISSFVYHSAKLLDYLEKTGLSHDRLANLELSYFQIHKHRRRPRALYDELSKNPELFIEALRYAFRPKSAIATTESENTESGDKSTTNRQVWELAFDLLEKWKVMPGLLEDGSVDAEGLRLWVFKARELAAECDRSEITDSYIGRRFAYSPPDPDGAWPHRAVRDLIEELTLIEGLANSRIASGLETQIFNNRGVTVRSLTDGGNQERTLVEKYEQDARQIQDQWPHTASILRDLADTYRREAQREDTQADLTQDLW